MNSSDTVQPSNALRILCSLLALLTLLCCKHTNAQSKPRKVLHIHMISGAREYQSTTSLRAWKKHLESRYSVKCTLSPGKDRTQELEGLEHLRQADLLVLFNRRFALTREHWRPIQSYLDSNRPVLGIRTASHAFSRNMPAFDRRILGASYHGHVKSTTVQVQAHPEARDHPILKDISGWERKGKLYKNNQFAKTTTILLEASGKKLKQPVAWTNENNNRRVFYTSMGLPHDFQNKQFLRLLRNAIEWTTRRALNKKKK